MIKQEKIEELIPFLVITGLFGTGLAWYYYSSSKSQSPSKSQLPRQTLKLENTNTNPNTNNNLYLSGDVVCIETEEGPRTANKEQLIIKINQIIAEKVRIINCIKHSPSFFSNRAAGSADYKREKEALRKLANAYPVSDQHQEAMNIFALARFYASLIKHHKDVKAAFQSYANRAGIHITSDTNGVPTILSW